VWGSPLQSPGPFQIKGASQGARSRRPRPESGTARRQAPHDPPAACPCRRELAAADGECACMKIAISLSVGADAAWRPGRAERLMLRQVRMAAAWWVWCA
jgi:hypothetical protein